MSLLATPSTRFRESFLEGAAEFAAEGRIDSTYAACLGYDLKSLERRFAHFVDDLLSLADESRLERGWYIDHVRWLVEGEMYLGQASIRPELCTAYLITYGGHIGYSIRPSRRQRGYGRQILALALEASSELGLKKVLVTCDSDNTASRKIIEYNGGQFERAMSMDARTFRAEGRKPQARVDKLRYWIDLEHPCKPLPTAPA